MNTTTTSESLAQMARELQYPPLNGGPTQDDIIRALSVASEIIEEYEIMEDDSDEKSDRIEELESAINTAVEELDEAIADLAYIHEIEAFGDDYPNRFKAIQNKLRRA